jgi:hypothetical protein
MDCPDSGLTQIDRELVNRASIAGPWTGETPILLSTVIQAVSDRLKRIEAQKDVPRHARACLGPRDSNWPILREGFPYAHLAPAGFSPVPEPTCRF